MAKNFKFLIIKNLWKFRKHSQSSQNLKINPHMKRCLNNKKMKEIKSW